MLQAARFTKDALETDSGESFDGLVRKLMLVNKDQSGELEVLAVFFDAGARTRPHIHEKDQVLYFLEGTGLVVTKTERRVCTAGDVVTVPAGTWHWHGATRDQAMGHLSIRQPGGTSWKAEVGNWGEY